MRREPLLAGLLCVVGAFVVLVGVGNPWVVVEVIGSSLLPAREIDVTGGDLAPGLRALGLVGLAGVPALAATRGRGRIVVGLLLLGVGVAVVAVVLRQTAGAGLGGRALLSDAVRQAGGAEGESAAPTGWSYGTAVGGVVLALAGLLVAVRGRRWTALGRRYEAPAVAAAPAAEGPAAERDLWAALDRGEDPTGPADPPASPAGPRD